MTFLFKKERDFLITPLVSNFLHLSRWLAALVVVLSHVRAVSFPSYANLEENGILWKLFYFVTSLGHEAVIIFFVLSGYLIGGEILRGLDNGSFSWKKYMTKRVVRLYIVLIPALFLTSIWDHVGYGFFNGSGMYDHYWTLNKETVHAFFLNLLMLQHSYGPLFGSNDPLWSLAYEFWYYLMFPLLVQVLYMRNSWLKAASVLAFAAIVALLNKDITLYFLIWLLGVGLWYLRSENILKLPYAGGVLTVLFLIAVVYSRYVSGFFGDFVVGVVFSGLILFFMAQPKISDRLSKLVNWPHNRTFADFSYSLYLLHFPLMLLAANVAFIYWQDFRKEADGWNFLFFILLTGAVYLYSYGVYWMTERKTKEITKRLLTVFA